MNVLDNKSFFFAGIGGIGMSALALWLHRQGRKVAGYDRTPSPVTQALQKAGIPVSFDENAMADSKSDSRVFVYTPALEKDSESLRQLAGGATLIRRSELLGLISRRRHTLAVAGTHGKTTTCAILAHLLRGAEKGCLAFVGGWMKNVDSNMMDSGKGELLVAEADEYGRSFLALHPDEAVITSMDPDHLDIYGDAKSMEGAFMDFASRVSDPDSLIVHHTLHKKIWGGAPRTYGFNEGDIQFSAVTPQSYGMVSFNYSGTQEIRDIRTPLIGNHNLLNATAAISLALNHTGEEQIREGMESFQGVKRRSEVVYVGPELVYVDDYAHHPRELGALLDSVEEAWPGREITAVFQPHLFSRTRDFYLEFGEVLSRAHRVYLMEIYPARERPMPGVGSHLILDQIVHNRKRIVAHDDFPGILRQDPPEVLLTLGAGDIDRLVPVLEAYYHKTLGPSLQASAPPHQTPAS